MSRKQKRLLLRIITAIILMAFSVALSDRMHVRGIVAVLAYIIIGHDVLKKAVRGFLNRRVFDENFLMAVATVGAIIIALYDKSNDFSEAVAVMLFYQIGEFFQSYAVGKSRRNVSELMNIRPDYASVEIDGKLVNVDPESIGVGSIIVVQPGEKIPIDGVVVDGYSSINTSALTGESLLRDVSVGDEALSGCINISGVIKIRTSREFGKSTASRILELVEEASSRKSRSENFISRFAGIYTPIVCYAALALAFVPPVIEILIGNTATWSVWIYRALTFLVISCPCALVISIPLSFFAAIGGASRNGILVKGSNYLEQLSQIKTLIFDKTGTLTKGVLDVEKIYCNTLEKEELLEYAVLAESASSHPISRSLKHAYGKEIDRSRVSEIEEIVGHGVVAKVDDLSVAIGNNKLMKRLGIEYISCSHPGTLAHIAINGEYSGYILVADTIKENSEEAVLKLKASGMRNIVMLTGDARKIAEKTAEELGIEEVFSELLPEDKVTVVEKQISLTSGKVAFVGDGINDAPVLSRADIGIAMGMNGSDAAIEAADVVLMDDDPMKIVNAIKISKKCVGIVRQNIVFTLGIKIIFLLLSALGTANMWFAIFADVGVMVIAVLNAMRLLIIPKE